MDEEISVAIMSGAVVAGSAFAAIVLYKVWNCYLNRYHRLWIRVLVLSVILIYFPIGSVQVYYWLGFDSDKYSTAYVFSALLFGLGLVILWVMTSWALAEEHDEMKRKQYMRRE